MHPLSLSNPGLKPLFQGFRNTEMKLGIKKGDPPPTKGGRKTQPRGEERDQHNLQNSASRGQEGEPRAARVPRGKLT